MNGLEIKWLLSTCTESVGLYNTLQCLFPTDLPVLVIAEKPVANSSFLY